MSRPSAPAPTVPTPSSSAPATSAPSSSAPPLAGQATIKFTYATTTGAVRNPYIAVWIENTASRLVKTVALWYLAGKGDRWLDSLTRYYRLAETGRTATSGTKAPGAYTLAWDGTDSAGVRVAATTYYVCIESAREHGPYGLIRQEVALVGNRFTKQLGSSAEISAATFTYVP